MRTQFVLAHSWLVAGGFCALALSSSLPAQTNGTSFPTVTIYASDPRAAEAGPDEGTFTVARTGSTNFALLVFYQLGGTASNGVDYEKLANTVSIPAGASNAQITVKPIDDDLVEGLETVVAQITGSPLACATCGYFIGYPSNAVVTIADNDGPASTNHPPEVKIALPSDGATFIAPANILLSALPDDVDGFVATVEFFEGTHSLGVTTNNPEIVGFGGGPVNPFMLTWTNVPAGAYTLTAKATDDQGAMATSAPVKITVSQEQQTVVNIEATDPDATEIPIVSPCLDIAQRFDPAVFTVTRAGNANIDLMVFYTVGGTASNGVDYLKLPGVVTIPAGALSATIEIFPLVDSLLEGTETVVVALQAPMCIAIFPPPPGCYLVGQEGLATAFIHDFPPPPVVTIVASDPDASETGPDPGTFTVSRTGATNDPLTVFYFTRGTALNGLDYRALFDYVVIPAGASSADVTVLPIDDELVEGPETVVVQLGILFPCGTLWETNVVIDPLFYFPAPYWVGYPSNALVTIADNDTSGANLPPDARIVTPPDGAVFVGPTNILLGADAFDRDGSVAQVEFFEGNNSLGLARGPLRTPFGTWLLIWSNAALGEYTLTAKATDNLGAMGVSAPVHLRVVSTPPPPPTNLPPLVSIVARDPIASEGSNFWWWPSPDGQLWTNVWSTWGVNLGGTNTATFVVHRTDGTNSDLVVYYSVSGTASNGVDYVQLPDTVTIPAGHRSARIVIIPIDDRLVEGIETVTLTLQAAPTPSDQPPYLVGFSRRATAIIVDNDLARPPCVRLSDGEFHLCLPATNGFCFRLEASTDLIRWVPICTNVVTEEAVHFIDPDAADLPHRFYRMAPEAQLLPDG